MKKVIVFSALIIGSGCATLVPSRANQLANISSGQIGCSPKEITIADIEASTWSASCKGKKFFCNSISSGGTSPFAKNSVAPTETIHCKEALK